MEAADTLVVNSSNYSTLTDDALGRLVRFESVESVYGKAGWGYQNNFPNYFSSATDNFDWTAGLGWEPTMAYVATADNGSKSYYYGSAWFSYASTSSNIAGQYVIRNSGYCRFKADLIPANGDKVDITAIYTRYSPDRVGDSRAAYQLILNSGSDVVRK